MEELPIPKNFIDWACSQSGCDGGNLKADTWICGIEWGQGSYGEGKYYRDELPKEIEAGAYIPGGNYDWAAHLTYTYGRSFAKLYAATKGEEIENYQDFVLARSDQDIYKLNLYPIAFDSTDYSLWIKYKLNEITGFDEKHLFQTWCFFNRFPKFAELVKANNPKLIIGSGVSYLKEFIACFGGASMEGRRIHFSEITPKSEANKRTKRRYYWLRINGGKTTLVVIPFFSGPSGLNSNHLLQEMGSAIRKLIDPIEISGKQNELKTMG